MDKDQIRAELDARGITYNARLGADKLQVILDEAIAAEKGEEAPAPVKEAPADAVAEEEAPPVADEREVDETKINVLDKNNKVSRVFTLEEQGENFVELAQEFAKKRGLRIGTVYKR